MKLSNGKHYALDLAKTEGLSWDGDNRKFVVEELLPVLNVPDDVRQVLRWAYGYDGSDRSYEMESDGSTTVPDFFMLGLIKEPPGVGHDMLNRVKDHRTPDGHTWTMLETCRWYKRCMIAFGYPKIQAKWRELGLILSSWRWWKTDWKE